MRASSLLSPVLGVASTHSKPIDIVSACNSRIRSFSEDRKSDNSGAIAEAQTRASPRSATAQKRKVEHHWPATHRPICGGRDMRWNDDAGAQVWDHHNTRADRCPWSGFSHLLVSNCG